MLILNPPIIYPIDGKYLCKIAIFALHFCHLQSKLNVLHCFCCPKWLDFVYLADQNYSRVVFLMFLVLVLWYESKTWFHAVNWGYKINWLPQMFKYDDEYCTKTTICITYIYWKIITYTARKMIFAHIFGNFAHLVRSRHLIYLCSVKFKGRLKAKMHVEEEKGDVKTIFLRIMLFTHSLLRLTLLLAIDILQFIRFKAAFSLIKAYQLAFLLSKSRLNLAGLRPIMSNEISGRVPFLQLF